MTLTLLEITACSKYGFLLSDWQLKLRIFLSGWQTLEVDKVGKAGRKLHGLHEFTQ